jgi:chromosome segregation ATPase
MVVGPNGTGKSSILCAICLGLGGEPRLLGRADKVEAFIQNGETEAKIELVVKNEDGDDAIVTRTISSAGSAKTSVFTWNGEIVSGKKVRERASLDFQIQLDNLCTFLPQEKVGNFSGINSKDLLLETEKTLSDNSDLYNTHMKLIQMQEDFQGEDNQVDNLKEKVELLEAEVKQYKLGVDRMEERKKAEEQADLLRKKIMWMNVDVGREKCLELKNQKDAAKKEVENLEDQLEPLERANNAARDRLDAATTEVSAFDKEIKAHERNMEKQKTKFEKHDDQIEETLAELASIDNTRARNESEAQILREKVEMIQNALEQQTPIFELEEAFAEARRDQENARSQYNEKKSKVQDLQRKLESVNNELSTENRKLERLQNEKEQRRNHVFRQFPEVKNAYNWIQNNRNAFRKGVIGPIACEISPKSNHAAAFLEQHVPNSSLKSFIVQDKSDYDLLYQKVRVEQNIPINIIQVDRISQDKSRVFSEQKMAMLKQEHGVIGYLDETFEGPEIVVEALKSNAAINKVLVGDDRTQDSLDNRGLGQILSESENGGNTLQSYCIFASRREQSFKYTSQISRYSGKPSLRYVLRLICTNLITIPEIAICKYSSPQNTRLLFPSFCHTIVWMIFDLLGC